MGFVSRIFDEYSSLIIGSIIFLIVASACMEFQKATTENIQTYKTAFSSQFSTH